jgi:hypothetical protein
MMKLLFLILIGGGIGQKLDDLNEEGPNLGGIGGGFWGFQNDGPRLGTRDTKKCPIGIGWFTNAQECTGEATKCAHADNVEWKGDKITIYAGCQKPDVCGDEYTLPEQTLKVNCTALGDTKKCKQGSEENHVNDTCDNSDTHCAYFPDVTAWNVNLGTIYAGCRKDCVVDAEEKYGPVTGNVTCSDPPTPKPEPTTTKAPSHSSVIQPFTFITLVVSSMVAMLSL